MHRWLNSFSSPSSSSSPKSPSDSPQKRNVGDYNFFRNRRRLHSPRRLTRQRKLRYLSDREVGLSLSNQVPSPGSPRSMPVSRSPSSLEFVRGLPQPLPLPDLALLRRHPRFSSSYSGDCPLPSPKDVPIRREGEDGDRTDSLIGDGVLPSSTIGSGFAYQTIRKSKEHVDTQSAKSPIDHSRKVHQDPNGVGSVQSNFRLNVPPVSAPTSGFSSPALSPRRSSVGEYFPSPYVAPQGFHAWSAPEAPAIDMHACFLSHASPEKNMSSPDRSPLHSPTVKSPHQNPKSQNGAASNPKSQNGAASPLHYKLSPESSTAWHDNNGHVNVHPLPLPPGTAVTSQSAFMNQTTAKAEVSSMTSQWQKGKLIGRGTFGSVYRATNRETGASCAMKEVDLIPNDPKSAECIKQLEQEIKVLSQLKHPNIVQYYGSEIVADHFYIYLEYVHPGSINNYIREHCGNITESVVRNFTRHILSGLAYLHSTKTIHRDIKGANLLVNESGVVKLADFGMAKHLSGQATNLSLKGSPYWMAPEIMHPAMHKDTNSELALAVDIWSLGCTIIEMLNGKPPWSEFEGVAAMFKAWKGSPPIPENLSPEGKDFLQCCFQRNPAERPSASMLLKHRFLRNLQHLDVPGCTQAFSGMKLIDKAHSPREWAKCKYGPKSISPGSQTTEGNLTSNGETDRQSHPETSDSAAASRHSPRSTLEALSSLSSPHSNHSTCNSSPSKAINSMHLRAGNSLIYALPRTHRKEVLHL